MTSTNSGLLTNELIEMYDETIGSNEELVFRERTNDDLVRVIEGKPLFLEAPGKSEEQVLEAMRRVDRANFLPNQNHGLVSQVHALFNRDQAYFDFPLEIMNVNLPYGVESLTCSQPSLVAAMSKMMELEPAMKVLEIGTGCGYHAAVTSELIGPSGYLVTMEYAAELAEFGKRNLESYFGKLDGRINVISGDGSKGFPQEAPFDRIYFTCAPIAHPQVILNFIQQLKPESGKILFPAWGNGSSMPLIEIGRENGSPYQKEYGSVRFVPLRGEKGVEYMAKINSK